LAIFLLIRHGENDFVGKRLAGQLPGVHLNEKGRQQAALIASTLSRAPIKAIYSSPLERALETAQPLADVLKLPVSIQPGLIEINFGRWQGKTVKQMHRLKLWKVAQETPRLMRFPEGESFLEAQQRLYETIEAIRANHEDQDLVACFSHSDAISLIVTYYLGLPVDNFHRVGIGTASMTSLVLMKDSPPHFGSIGQVFEIRFEKRK
jgi:broad specificity phosphatase PhoE